MSVRLSALYKPNLQTDFMYDDKMAFDFMHSDFPPVRLYALRQLLASPKLWASYWRNEVWIG